MQQPKALCIGFVASSRPCNRPPLFFPPSSSPTTCPPLSFIRRARVRHAGRPGDGEVPSYIVQVRLTRRWVVVIGAAAWLDVYLGCWWCRSTLDSSMTAAATALVGPVHLSLVTAPINPPPITTTTTIATTITTTTINHPPTISTTMTTTTMTTTNTTPTTTGLHGPPAVRYRREPRRRRRHWLRPLAGQGHLRRKPAPAIITCPCLPANVRVPL